jgi:uncharacterized OB-fold protein
LGSKFFSLDGFNEKPLSGKLSVPRCMDCGNYIVPPTAMCNRCLSIRLEWVGIEPKGKLLSFSKIYVSHGKLAAKVPYLVGIVETSEGVRLPGMFKEESGPRSPQINDPVSIVVDAGNYYFVAAQGKE